MRDIKFRGKRVDNSEWVYGYYVVWEGRYTHFIYTGKIKDDFSDFVFHEVDPATVGQYTGLKDKNGKEIWEGDIVKYHPECNRGIGRVLYEGSGFYVGDEFNGLLDDFATMGIEVTGNIHDNPELLEGD